MALENEIKLGRAVIPTGYHRVSRIAWEWPKDELRFVVDIFPTAEDSLPIEHPAEVEEIEIPDLSDPENPTTRTIENIKVPAWTEPPSPLSQQLYTFDFARVQPPTELLQQILSLPQEEQDTICFALLRTLLYRRLKGIPDYENSQDV